MPVRFLEKLPFIGRKSEVTHQPRLMFLTMRARIPYRPLSNNFSSPFHIDVRAAVMLWLHRSSVVSRRLPDRTHPSNNTLDKLVEIYLHPLSSGVKHQVPPNLTTPKCQESNRLDIRDIRRSSNQVNLMISTWLDVGWRLEGTKLVSFLLFIGYDIGRYKLELP